MTIISNSCLDRFPNNSPSKFTIQLPCPISFDGSYVIGLREIFLPTLYENISEEASRFYCGESLTGNGITGSTHKISPGFYPSIKKLVKAINKSLGDDLNKEFLFVYDEYKNRVIIQGQKSPKHHQTSELNQNYRLDMPCSLAKILGFKVQQTLKLTNFAITASSIKVAEFSPELLINSVYLYSSAIETSEVSNFHANLMRIINITNTNGSYLTREFQKVQYHRLLCNDISELSFELRSNSGELFPIDLHSVDPVIFVLHIRRETV